MEDKRRQSLRDRSEANRRKSQMQSRESRDLEVESINRDPRSIRSTANNSNNPKHYHNARRTPSKRPPQRNQRPNDNKRIRTSGSHNIRNRSPKNKKNRAFKGVLALLVVLAILVGIGSLGYMVYEKKYGLTDETMELSKYYELGMDDEVAIILDNEILAEEGLVSNGVYYFPLEAVSDYINSRFYWDANENNLLYTLSTYTIQVAVGEQSYTEGTTAVSTDYQIVKTDGQDTYVAAEFVALLSDIEYEIYEEPNRLVVTSVWGDIEVATVSKDTQVRYQGGVKSPILSEIEKGAKVEVIDAGEDWTKVSTEDGIIGYMQTKYCDNIVTETLVSDFVEQEYSNISEDYTINMAWHQVTSSASNSTVLETIADTKGLTTIAPTWFFIDSVSGDITSLASETYVNYAHQSGIEVWAVLNDFDGGINSYDQTYEVLSSTSARTKIINEVISESLKTGIDGINVDIELVSTDAGEHFIQFIRELSVKCRQNGLVLSIANYPPKSYNMHYDYEEQGIVADYVIIMGYDEHYSGSLEAGPVASISYVEEGITSMLEMVSADKVINAIPFYSRLWEETPKTDEELEAQAGTEEGEYLYKVSSTSYGMNGAVNVATDNGAEIVWDEEAMSNYATWTSGETIYEIWIEDATSIEEKLNLMKEYNLAGTAAWKLGLEDSSIWNVIEKYVN